MKGIKGKAAVVTGAGQGIGKAIVERLIEEGASVLAVDKSADALQTLDPGERVKTLVADVTHDDTPFRIMDACHAAFGRVHILVNNAGVGNAPPLHETTDEFFDFQIGVNLRSTFRISREAIPDLRATRGCIVNNASANGLRGYRRQSAYTAAKAGVIGLTRNLAAEYGPDGIRVNAIAPGMTGTPTQTERLATARFRAQILGTMPLGFVGEPKDIAAAFVFLASDDARFISGQTLAVDGGQTETVFINDELIRAWEIAEGERSRDQ